MKHEELTDRLIHVLAHIYMASGDVCINDQQSALSTLESTAEIVKQTLREMDIPIDEIIEGNDET